MRIENSGPLGGARGTKKSAKTGSSSGQFSVSEEEESQATQNVSTTTNVTNLDALLSLQAVDDPLNSKKKSAERGFDLLDRLDEMRLGMLSGKLSPVQVTRMAQKVKNLGRTGDEKLDSILSDIDMRARVELAKIGIYDV
ncbi:MAG: flagellar assembly protein FliX [Hyphomicrobiales bacterium]